MGNLDRQALHEALKRQIGTSTLSKVVSVNYDLIANDTIGKVFKTVADAQTWIADNGGTLSNTNTWTIKLPSGTITETLVKMPYIDFEFSAGTIVDELVSDVYFTSVYDFEKAILKNATINTLTIPSGKCIYLQNCIIISTEIEDDTCNLTCLDGVFMDIDLGNSNCFIFNAYIKGDVFANFNNTAFARCFINNEVTIGVGDTLKIRDTYVGSIINNGTLKNYQFIHDSNITPTENTKGATRYTETANSSKFEMIMKTGASTWEWVTIKENVW